MRRVFSLLAVAAMMAAKMLVAFSAPALAGIGTERSRGRNVGRAPTLVGASYRDARPPHLRILLPVLTEYTVACNESLAYMLSFVNCTVKSV